MEEKESDNEHHESDNESIIDFDAAEYEKKLDELLRKVVLAEINYSQVRSLLYQRKQTKIAENKRHLAAETSKEYNQRKRHIFDIAHKNRLESRAMFRLELECMDIDLSEKIRIEQEDNMPWVTKTLIDDLKEVIGEKMDRELKVRTVIGALISLPTISEHTEFNLTKNDSMSVEFAKRRRTFVQQPDVHHNMLLLEDCTALNEEISDDESKNDYFRRDETPRLKHIDGDMSVLDSNQVVVEGISEVATNSRVAHVESTD